MRFIGIVSLLMAVSGQSVAGPYHQAGKISDITVGTLGLMLKMDSGLPDNCAGTPYGWMLVDQQHTALTSVVLAAWAAQRTEGVIYTSGRAADTGYCLVSQFDPVN